jgi:PKD repeat protein
MQLRQGTASNNITYHTYLQFNVTGLVGPVSSAKLRLAVTDASPDGGAVFDVANTWTETGINWNNAPQPASGTPLANAGVVAKGQVVEITLPLSEFTRGNGSYSFELVTSSSDSTIFSTREAATGKPQLVLAQGGGTLPSLTADFKSDKQTGAAPLTVNFDSSASTGNPTTWTWDFNNDNVVDSTQQNPSFIYSNPGTYTVKLTIGDGSTTSVVTKTNFITVSSVGPPPPPGITASLVADSYVANSKPTTNYGTQTTIQLRQGTPTNNITYHSYLQFNVSGLTGPVIGAKLRLTVTDASPDGGSVFDVSNAWTEAGINWNNAPQPTSPTPLARAGAVIKGKSVDIALPASEFTRGNGVYSFELVTSSTDSAIYSSKQTTSPPQLILTQ